MSEQEIEQPRFKIGDKAVACQNDLESPRPIIIKGVFHRAKSASGISTSVVYEFGDLNDSQRAWDQKDQQFVMTADEWLKKRTDWLTGQISAAIQSAALLAEKTKGETR